MSETPRLERLSASAYSAKVDTGFANRIRASNWSSELLLCRDRIEFGDLRKAIFLRGVRAGDEGAAYLGAVPARHDAETQRLFGLDVTRGEDLHGGSFEVRCPPFAETP